MLWWNLLFTLLGINPITKPPLLQESRFTGAASPNLVDLKERKVPVKRKIRAANSFHWFHPWLYTCVVQTADASWIFAAVAPIILCAGIFSLHELTWNYLNLHEFTWRYINLHEFTLGTLGSPNLPYSKRVIKLRYIGLVWQQWINQVLSIFLIMKRQRKREEMIVIRWESLLKGGTLNFWSSFIIRYRLNNSYSGVYLS